MALNVLLDANVLLLMLVGLVRRRALGTHRRTKSYAPEDFDTLMNLIPADARLLSTPHILTEVSDLMEPKVDDSLGREVHAMLKSALIQRIDEHFVGWETAGEHKVFERLGLTDAAIAVLVEKWKLEGRELRVITDDLDLWIYLSRQPDVEVVYFFYLTKKARA